MKTQGIKDLVEQVVDSLPTPYTDDIIDDVFLAIENTPEWRQRYDESCNILGAHSANQWCGKWISIKIGKQGENQVHTPKSTLISSYSVLDADIPIRPTEEEARKKLYAYYKENEVDLPKDISAHKAQIITLITEGMSVEDAFNAVLDLEYNR
jgi:hypothetical protein